MILPVINRIFDPAVTDLPQLLFTAGMTILDSADSVLMLYSYSGFPERTWAIFDKRPALSDNSIQVQVEAATDSKTDAPASSETRASVQVTSEQRTKANVMSGLSIILTLMSILVAFRLVPILTPSRSAKI